MDSTLLSFIFLAAVFMGFITRRFTTQNKESLSQSLQQAAMSGLLYTALLFTLNYFTGVFDKKQDTLPQEVVQNTVAPLNTAKNFAEQSVETEELHTVTTPLGTYVFSNAGAVLQKAVLHKLGGDKQDITILQNSQAFVLGLEESAPYAYTFAGQHEYENIISVHYTAPFDGGTLEKIFKIDQTKYTITLDVKCIDCEHAHTVRCFMQEPEMQPRLAEEVDAAFTARSGDKKLEKIKLGNQNIMTDQWLYPEVFVLTDKYFICGLVNNFENVKRAYFTYNRSNQRGFYELVTEGDISSDKAWHCQMYVGPKTLDAVLAVDKRLETTMSYGMFAFIAKPLDYALDYVNDIVGNYGLAIILLTVFLKLIVMPFTARGQRKMKDHAKVDKKMKYIKQKYQHDPERLKAEQEALIKKHGMPPLLSGCLPALLFFPVMFALNSLLRNSLSVYSAKFLWISNLAAKDPYYILPILIGWAYIFMPSISLTGSDREGLQKYMTALFMGGVMTTLAAGAQLFNLVNFLLIIFEQRLVKGWKRAQ